MKKRLCRAASAAMAALLLVCGTCSCAAQEESGKVMIVSTGFAAFDFARQVAGDRAQVNLLLPPGSESHSFEPTAHDMTEIEDCDLFIYIGGESDVWAQELADADGENDGRRLLKLMDCVKTLEEETVEGMEIRAEAEEEGEYDEHVWTSPKNAALITQKIAEQLCGIDPENAEYYSGRAEAYEKELDKLDGEFCEIVSTGKRNTIVFGDRFPLRYFAEEYGLEYYAAFPGCSEETEPSAATVAFLIDKVKEEEIPVVFCIELSNGLVADTICAETGAVKRSFNACHNVTKESFESGATYIGLMRENEEALREALN